MEIGILTLPLNKNFGGVLQAYALQTALKRMGHTPYLIMHKPVLVSYEDYKYAILNRWRCRHEYAACRWFVKHHMTHTCKVKFDARAFRSKFEAVVVGSDQVWRPMYTKPLLRYFLDFLENDKQLRKVAYAASFGTDKWEFNQEQTMAAKRLIKQFDAVTVREDSGIGLCKKHLDCDATLALDPTLLLDKEDYASITEYHATKTSDGNLFVYTLDRTPEKAAFTQALASSTGLKPFTVTGTAETDIDAWLKAFQDAEFVLTDSFHGCVFSILFHKPFLVFGNKTRGQARFNSLLSMLGLESHLVDPSSRASTSELEPVDWNKTDSILGEMKSASLSFLSSSLR